jgi:hypothetical protein
MKLEKFLEQHHFIVFIVMVCLCTLFRKVIGFEEVVIVLLVQLIMDNFWRDYKENNHANS